MHRIAIRVETRCVSCLRFYPHTSYLLVCTIKPEMTAETEERRMPFVPVVHASLVSKVATDLMDLLLQKTPSNSQ